MTEIHKRVLVELVMGKIGESGEVSKDKNVMFAQWRWSKDCAAVAVI
jgi:hypothetical protein